MISIPLLGDWLSKIKTTKYDDMVDRLNYYVTAWLFLFFTAAISAKQYLGQPIQCWVPAEWRGGWEEYAEDYCFIQNTYYVPRSQNIPSVDERFESQITYYQWVPVVFALQAFMFYVPNLLWRAFCFQSGVNIHNILVTAKTIAVNTKPEERKANMADLANYILESLESWKIVMGHNGRLYYGNISPSKNPLKRFSEFSGAYVTVLYLFIKLLYIGNIVLQYFLLAQFIGAEHTFWGVNIAREVFAGAEVSESSHFPRVTICDVPIRKLGRDKQAYERSIQCVLMINMFNDKVFLFFWFWLLFLFCVTVINFFYWAFTSLMPHSRSLILDRYMHAYWNTAIRNQLIKRDADRQQKKEAADEAAKKTEKSAEDGKSEKPAKKVESTKPEDRWIADPNQWPSVQKDFAKNGLRTDGLLILRFIAAHAGDLTAVSLASAMIDEYKQRQHMRGRMQNHLPQIQRLGLACIAGPKVFPQANAPQQVQYHTPNHSGRSPTNSEQPLLDSLADSCPSTVGPADPQWARSATRPPSAGNHLGFDYDPAGNMQTQCMPFPK